jgi:uncharacterized OB-fold protein
MEEDVMLRADLGVQSTDLEIAPLQAAARQNQLLIKRCVDCRQPHWHPRALCPFCLSCNTVWEESTGRGEIYAFTIFRRSRTGPYAIAYIRLDDGPLMLSHIVDCRPIEVAIGKRVSVCFQLVPDGPPLPVFTLSQASMRPAGPL